MNNSAGILCFRKKTDDIEFFVCSPGGIYWKNRTQWSFPKGHVENGETDLDAAFREFFEETGFPIREKINNEDLIDYGIIKQNRSKRVHLFVVEYADINPDSCVSNETMIEYLPKSGNLIKIKEIGKYAWLTYDSIKENGIEAYFPIYEDILNKKKKIKKTVNIIKDIDIFNHFQDYDVILLGTNTYCTLCNGLQHKVRLDYPEVDKANMKTKYGDPRKLGQRLTIKGEPTISLCYITHGFNFRPDIKPDYLDYDALENCLKTANIEFNGKKVASTILGSSRFDGNGNKEKILDIIDKSITRFDITIFDYYQKSREEELKEEWESIKKWKDIDYKKFNELIKERKKEQMKDVIKMELLAIKIAELEIEKEQYKLLFEQYKENYIEHVSQPTYHFYQYYLNQYEMVSAKLEFFKNELIKVREE